MIIDESVPATAKADIFMFGMTVLEVSADALSTIRRIYKFTWIYALNLR